VLLIDHSRVLLDADAESLRGSALTVTGPSPAVQALAGQHELLHSESLGGHSRAVVRLRPGADGDSAGAAGLSWEPTNLQQLVVAVSLHTARTTAATRTGDLEEVTR
jgi:ABC-2 type transport system ATP-binding protein